ncbi:polyhydroxyalkanoic acid system family protein [Lysobacter sp. GX 14042]|uniref:polyhydroxyalkanoic acid system family protein n=1 Tax=Lysobacter sp. GX 14042 TaxID=2907155 RepID=UPI001F2D5174|nr:polyhydroxyalkanoic acid system family protein [Lysobacter sp. GX 14042]MCE7031418.1 polyhydroxyalkanoic acid system family protein [Lysobacter sp. GX 14042]
MASIDIRHPHSLPPAHARQRVQEVAEILTQRFGVHSEWDGDILGFSGMGVEGHLALLPGELHFSAQLGFLLAAMQGSIEQEVRRVLAERFG